jgi:NAD(P)-dependent dehydrogenase (short-subunit alcohol dehydrogenase family)
VGALSAAAIVERREPKLDILVNNAGAAWGADFDEFPESGWDKVMNLNLKTPFFLSQALAAPLRAAATAEKPAKVINIASIDGIFVNPMETYSYAASKSGLIHLTRRMAARLIGDRIVVSAIAPGPFKSDMNKAARDNADEGAGGTHRHRRGHGGSRDLSRLPRRRLRGRHHHRGRWRDCVRESGHQGRWLIRAAARHPRFAPALAG